ncbi:hypothetical protein I5M32_12220 [Pedobacter sp. SD-b]|uniref:Uncharacterized protein n=1 Tax=Pedobacter segetis TaxID=2793069 RepID=A0ABS1BLF6_9SPHI|nr:hypothetical protein [Pedobacter segetis]MBK0383725.1 hypothetical protein [Pedobacter segetis]
MLDKDFDQFFKSSFEDFEVQSAANSWDKITAGLEKKPKSKSFGMFWMAAASIVVVLGIGIGLYTKPKEVIKLRGNADEVLNQVAQEQKIEPEVLESVAVRTDKTKAVLKSKNDHSLVSNHKVDLGAKNNFKNDATIGTKTNVLPIKKTDTDQPQIVAIKAVRAKTVTERILDDEASKTKEESEIKAQPLLAQNTVDDNLTEDGNQIGKKLKIKSVGDFVNFVVAKVDRREEKIIKVSKTEESDNEVTGINLGLFKFRKID